MASDASNVTTGNAHEDMHTRFRNEFGIHFSESELQFALSFLDEVFEEGVKAERERMAVWAKEHSKFADAQPVKDDSDARWEIHYAGYREAIGNLIAYLSYN